MRREVFIVDTMMACSSWAWTNGPIAVEIEAAALDWLVNHGGLREGTAQAFRQALEMPHPMARATCAPAMYDPMYRYLDRPDPAIATGQRMRRIKVLKG